MLEGKKMFCVQGIFMKIFVDFLMKFPPSHFYKCPCVKVGILLQILCPTL